ncbi:MAG: MBL fold metallo-hydrolase [Syntrophobacterales bacterium]|jgi:7,8-dihydropterin-6-yl-methyl-4-(beta-D-ribofuranosyl)aminobenzene 5'-phosphate synthase
MRKLDLLLLLALSIFYIMIFKADIFVRSRGVDEKLTMKNTFKSIHIVSINKLSITVIYDNNPYTEGLRAEWGLSCLIRGSERTILFDTGGNGSFLLENMNKLGINPRKIDTVVLSHIHGDHVGGLKEFLDKNRQVTVYLPMSFPQEFKDNLMSSSIRIMEVHDATEICEGVYATGELGAGIKEQSLIVHTTQGIIVITGCAHPGIVSILKRAKDLIKDDILLAMGGFHLGGASKKDLEKIILSFRKLGVKFVGPCHCSGDLARQMFKEEYGDSYIHLGVGRVIEF